jgi:hypothetical protein
VAGLRIASAAGFDGALRLDGGAIGGGDGRSTDTKCNDRKSEYESNSHHGDASRLRFEFPSLKRNSAGLPNATTGANLD